MRNKTIRITNKNIHKHFSKPIIPFVVSNIQTTNISTHIENKILKGILQNAQKRCCLVSSELHKNAEIQTDYRESETQTEPWEPPYKIVRGNNCYYIHNLIKNELVIYTQFINHNKKKM